MTFEEKFAAMKALAGFDTALHMRSMGEWYCLLPGVEIGGDGILQSVGADGPSPEQAIRNTWEQITTLLPVTQYLVIRVYQTDRRQLRWNGFMWEDVTAHG